jgi:hypothetical protein
MRRRVAAPANCRPPDQAQRKLIAVAWRGDGAHVQALPGAAGRITAGQRRSRRDGIEDDPGTHEQCKHDQGMTDRKLRHDAPLLGNEPFRPLDYDSAYTLSV